MATDLKGYTQLQARLKAVGSSGSGMMRTYATLGVGELRRNIPRKTSNTSRTLHVASVTETSARIEGNAVAKWLDEGTGLFGPRHHVITPTAKKALAFHVGTFGKGGSLRLTGTPRKGKAGMAAALIVVRSVKGMKARPYVDRSLNALKGKLGVDLIISRWNSAA